MQWKLIHRGLGSTYGAGELGVWGNQKNQEVGLMQTNKQRASLKTGQKIVYFFVLPIVALAVVLGILGAVTFNLFLF